MPGHHGRRSSTGRESDPQVTARTPTRRRRVKNTRSSMSADYVRPIDQSKSKWFNK
jgi:hypothetical protein